jgi:ribosomal protein L37AE/L43A
MSCPYCGEPDLRPADETDAWHCQICDRVWRLTLLRVHGSRQSNGATA